MDEQTTLQATTAERTSHLMKKLAKDLRVFSEAKRQIFRVWYDYYAHGINIRALCGALPDDTEVNGCHMLDLPDTQKIDIITLSQMAETLERMNSMRENLVERERETVENYERSQGIPAMEKMLDCICPARYSETVPCPRNIERPSRDDREAISRRNKIHHSGRNR
jgi:hypothetical protein